MFSFNLNLRTASGSECVSAECSALPEKDSNSPPREPTLTQDSTEPFERFLVLVLIWCSRDTSSLDATGRGHIIVTIVFEPKSSTNDTFPHNKAVAPPTGTASSLTFNHGSRPQVNDFVRTRPFFLLNGERRPVAKHRPLFERQRGIQTRRYRGGQRHVHLV